jgi:LysM repeat protein
MKMSIFLWILAQISLFWVATSVVNAQQTVAQSLGILDEKVNRLQAQIEDLQFQLQKDQKDIQKLQTDLEDLRRSGGTVSANDIKALDDRITAVDAARQKDKQAIIDQLAKELANVGGAKPAVKPAAPSQGKEHVVQKGDTLSGIAKSYGVTIADLKKVNNLASDDILVGQKLTIPPH